MEKNAVPSVPLFEDEHSGRRMKTANETFLVKAAERFFQRRCGFIDRDKSEANEIGRTSLYGQRAAPSKASIALPGMIELYPG